MSFSAAVVLASLMIADLPVGTEEGKIEFSNRVLMRVTGKKNHPTRGREHVFRAEIEFKLEQVTGNDTVIGGTRVPGKLMRHIHSTMEIHDGQTITASSFHENENIGKKRQEGNFSYTIKIESVDNHKVRLDVSTKDECKSTSPDRSTRSRILGFQARKTVNLGEKIKLDLADESLLGFKATFEGLIEEKVED